MEDEQVPLGVWGGEPGAEGAAGQGRVLGKEGKEASRDARSPHLQQVTHLCVQMPPVPGEPPPLSGGAPHPNSMKA